MNKKNITIYVDMDGVIADFNKKMKEHKLCGTKLKMIQGIYTELEIYSDAKHAMDTLRDMGYTIHIATKIPDDNPYAATEKLLWLREHLPEYAVDVTITPDKGQLGDENDFIIDDRPHKAKLCNFKGTLLSFGVDGEYKDWASIIAFFKAM